MDIKEEMKAVEQELYTVQQDYHDAVMYSYDNERIDELGKLEKQLQERLNQLQKMEMSYENR